MPSGLEEDIGLDDAVLDELLPEADAAEKAELKERIRVSLIESDELPPDLVDQVDEVLMRFMRRIQSGKMRPIFVDESIVIN